MVCGPDQTCSEGRLRCDRIIGGLAEPSKVLKVSSQSAGTVRAIHFRPGDNVKEGDVLLEIAHQGSHSSSGGGDPKITPVLAPMDGMVLSLAADVGSQVGTEDLIEIGDLSRMTVTLFFAWDDRHKYKNGMQLSLEPYTELDHRWEGVIERIDPRPVNYEYKYALGILEGSVDVYHAYVELDNQDGSLLPHMPLKARVWHERPLEERG